MQTAWFLAEAAPPAGQQNPLMPLLTMVPMLMILAYFMLIRPQRRQQEGREKMVLGLKKNDLVVTIGGIYGTVVNVRKDADEVTLRIDDSTGAKVRVTMASISKVISDTPSEKEKSA